jgi:hypothetical protein
MGARLISNLVSNNNDQPKVAIAIAIEILRNCLESSPPPNKTIKNAPAIGNQISVLSILNKEKGKGKRKKMRIIFFPLSKGD